MRTGAPCGSRMAQPSASARVGSGQAIDRRPSGVVDGDASLAGEPQECELDARAGDAGALCDRGACQWAVRGERVQHDGGDAAVPRFPRTVAEWLVVLVGSEARRAPRLTQHAVPGEPTPTLVACRRRGEGGRLVELFADERSGAVAADRLEHARILASKSAISPTCLIDYDYDL
jgi:hypothetical protein